MSRLLIILSMLCVFVCASILATGCSKKIIRQSTVFDLDKTFAEKSEDSRENFKDKGIQLARERNFVQAIDLLKKYTQDRPADFSAFNALAISYKNTGDFSNAMLNFEKALNLASAAEERAKILANIGNLYYSDGKYQAALGFYKEAASEFDKNPMYMILIARTFVVLGDYDRAKKVLSTLNSKGFCPSDLDKGEDRGLNNYLLAEIYTGLNDEKKVYANIEEALKLDLPRFRAKLLHDMRDEKNLFYTLKGDKRVNDILARHGSSSM
jgi:tetratricopeptide (TPR) repeat protein